MRDGYEVRVGEDVLAVEAGEGGAELAGAALDALDESGPTRRNAGPELRVGRYRVRPNKPLLGKLARVGGRVGYGIGIAAMREKLGALGIAAPILMAVESELNREGLSLGELAAPAPMPGTLAAVAPTAVLGRMVAQRL